MRLLGREIGLSKSYFSKSALLEPHCLDSSTLCRFTSCLLPSQSSSFFCRKCHSNLSRIGRKMWCLQVCPLGVALAASKHEVWSFSHPHSHKSPEGFSSVALILVHKPPAAGSPWELALKNANFHLGGTKVWEQVIQMVWFFFFP